MNNKYKSYKNKNLLEDEDFIRNMLYPTPETDDYWNSLVEYGLLSTEELNTARTFMEAVKKPDEILSDREKGELWKKIETTNSKNRNKQSKRHRLFYLVSAAAILLLLFSIPLFNQPILEETETDIFALMQQVPLAVDGSQGIRLIVSDEDTYVLDQKSADIILNEEGNIRVDEDVLTKKTADAKEGKINYNQLIIPKGTRSKLTLPDGTTMHINSGSHVIFPERFETGKRELFVNGEVFLEVAPDVKNPFLIHTKEMTVRVTGTSLNISAYEEEDLSVVLVSGSVIVKTPDKQEAPLSPNQMLTYTNNTSSIRQVEVSDYVSWKEGYLICDRENLPALMKKISRFYGNTIICDPALSLFHGNGKLDLKDDFELLIKGLKSIFPIEVVKKGDTYYIQTLIN